jgi:pyruvate kinase
MKEEETAAMRKTKIICTIGPASESEEKLKELILAGMNVARFNFSHGSHEEHEAKFLRLRRIRIQMNLPIATLLDTKGPEIRLRDFENGRVELKRGQNFTLTTDKVMGNEERASITYKDLPGDVGPGTHILIDDGLIGLKVLEVKGHDIVCVVENGGPVSNKKGINVPDAELSMPFISEQDRSDIEFGCHLGFDFIACSFTRTAQDIRDIREILKKNGSNMQVIAKIESTQGVKNIDEILDEADGVMVARGDLGVEVPLEDVPIIQKEIIAKAQKKGKIVVTATQMLDSMIHNPRPTRAEATDVANAIYDGTTAIMLSGETAAGQYPVEAVRIMGRIAERAEHEVDYKKHREHILKEDGVNHDTTAAICHACCMVADDTNASAIIAVTISGFTARRLSRLRPTVPIIACTTSVRAACQMNLLFGVVPLIIGMEEKGDALIESAVAKADMTGLISKGDKVVIAAGIPLGKSGNTNMIKVEEVS